MSPNFKEQLNIPENIVSIDLIKETPGTKTPEEVIAQVEAQLLKEDNVEAVSQSDTEPTSSTSGVEENGPTFIPEFTAINPNDPESPVYISNAGKEVKVVLDKDQVEAFRNGTLPSSELFIPKKIESVDEVQIEGIMGVSIKNLEEDMAKLGDLVENFKKSGLDLNSKIDTVPKEFDFDSTEAMSIMKDFGLVEKLHEINNEEVLITQSMSESLRELKENLVKIIFINKEIEKLEQRLEIINSEEFYNISLKNNEGSKQDAEKYVIQTRALSEENKNQCLLVKNELQKAIDSLVGRIEIE